MAARHRKRSDLAIRLGQNLCVLRTNRDWTQANLAERVGVDTETISRYERGVALPSLETLEKLAQSLRIPLTSLLMESSARAEDQALALFGWLNDLPDSDRLVVLDVTKRLCQHLRPSKRKN